MSGYRWIPWSQPVLTGNDEYGVVSASSINATTTGMIAFPWKASDGLHEGNDCSWESAKDAIPAWWRWSFPVTLRITHLKLYNKYSSFRHLTKNVSVYADADRSLLIAQGTFEEGAFTVLDLELPEPVVTDTLWIVCEDGYSQKNTYVGIGEVEITAQEGIRQCDVLYLDWDGTVLKEDTVDFGGISTPLANPVRAGYTFDGWSDSTVQVTSDMVVHALYSPITVSDRYLLTTLRSIFTNLSIPVETGVFSDSPPDCYAVLTPLYENYELFADNRPVHEVQEVRISLFDKGNYLRTRDRIVNALLSSEITITDRRYVAHEDDTGYHHSAIDVAQVYNTEE